MSREERGERGENCMRIAFPDSDTLGLTGIVIWHHNMLLLSENSCLSCGSSIVKGDIKTVRMLWWQLTTREEEEEDGA